MKKIIIFAILIMLVCFIFLPMKQQYVIGVAGNDKGDFVIGLSLRNKQNEHDLLFYNSDCNYIGKVRIKYRGGITIGCFDNYLIVQKNDSLKKSFYDFKGSVVNDVIYSGDHIRGKRNLFTDNYNLEYAQDFWGTEHIYYTSKNYTTDVDIDYSYYNGLKILNCLKFLTILSFLFVIGWMLYKKNEKISK